MGSSSRSSISTSSRSSINTSSRSSSSRRRSGVGVNEDLKNVVVEVAWRDGVIVEQPRKPLLQLRLEDIQRGVASCAVGQHLGQR